MAEPSVSVVTPSYNQASFVRDTIESVRHQTYPDLQHVVIDGDSDDGTVDILREYDHLEWVSEPDNGQADAINKGFRRVEGDIVGWLNSDDPFVFCDTVQRAVDAFRYTDADIVYGHALLIDGENRLLRVMHVPPFDRAKLRRFCFLLQPSVFFRREVVEENELDTSLQYSMDYDLWLRLADQDYEWHRIDAVLAADRNYDARKSGAEDGPVRQETIDLREERGIYGEPLFDVKQTLDKVDWRVNRVRGLSQLWRVLQAPEERFAIDIERPSIPDALYTQLYRRKRDLV